jgi:hypothetical protein
MNFNFFCGHGHVTIRFDSHGFELIVDNYQLLFVKALLLLLLLLLS